MLNSPAPPFRWTKWPRREVTRRLKFAAASGGCTYRRRLPSAPLLVSVRTPLILYKSTKERPELVTIMSEQERNYKIGGREADERARYMDTGGRIKKINYTLPDEHTFTQRWATWVLDLAFLRLSVEVLHLCKHCTRCLCDVTDIKETRYCITGYH